ncbi:MAG: sulfatase-like hydrolase/transferase [Clostridia bacterium]|nr:sulfatase-like hydrolase/transferase [Clostridia bacterium]MBR0327783.1 sulfatase-like hydrolase/transferase [Clostridia bacterium]
METAQRPNILWICTDQHRAEALGCYGNKFVKTPNIDRLAENGVRFEHAYCQAPVCAPSRAAMLTGRYARNCHVRQNGQDISENEILVTRILHDNGYTGGLSGKLHLSGCQPDACRTMERRINDGYDYFAWSHDNDTRYDWVMNGYTQWLRSLGLENKVTPREDCRYVFDGMPAEYSQARWCADRAIDFMKAAKANNMPWFFSFNCFDPHHPFDPPKEYLDRYLPFLDEIPLPNYYEGELETKTPAQRREHLGAYNVKGNFAYDDMTDYDHRLLRASYYALCDLVDEQVGRMIAYLEESGQLDNTVILFHSDHGESLGDHGMYLKGCYFYEPSVRVPLIISYKNKFLSGKVCNGLVELIDIAPTLLEICGIDAHPGMQGKSLYPLLCGEAPLDKFREDVFCESCKCKMSGQTVTYGSMLRTERYKITMVHDLAPSFDRDKMCELYDLEADPDERTNLYYDPAYADIKAEMLEKFCNRQALIADPLPMKSMPW